MFDLNNNKVIYRGDKIPMNTIIYTLNGNVFYNPTDTSIQIGQNNHIEDEWGQYINHSCYPSVKIVGNNLVTLKEINDGDLITYDYNESEDIVDPFICNCCKKTIGGKLRYNNIQQLMLHLNQKDQRNKNTEG